MGLLLAGGAIVNVVVAWAIMSIAPVTQTSETEIDPRELQTLWERHKLAEWPDGVLNGSGGWFQGRRYNYTREQDDVLWLQSTPRMGWMIIVIRAGWPCLALHGDKLQGDDGTGGWIGLIGDDDVLPFHPLWPGFAINTVFYAAILWMLFAAPFALRRRIREGGRRRRGLCVNCAYDLRGAVGGAEGAGDGSTTCPECGSVR